MRAQADPSPALFDGEAYVDPERVPVPIASRVRIAAAGRLALADLVAAHLGLGGPLPAEAVRKETLTVMVGPHEHRVKLRVRDVGTLVDDPARLHEVTVRRFTPKGADADEWLGFMGVGDRPPTGYAYGWMRLRDDGAPSVRHWVLLEPRGLTTETEQRAGCLVRDNRGKFIHHAPGGAGFLVIDLRRIREAVVWHTSPGIVASTYVAPLDPVPQHLWGSPT